MSSEEIKEFVITEYELVTNRVPLTSWEIAHLFYKVPEWAKYSYKDPRTGSVVFTNLLQKKGEE